MKAFCLNNISKVALDTLKGNDVTVDNIDGADSILVRSQEMKEMDLPKNILAVARAGAGVNNIPLEKYAKEGASGRRRWLRKADPPGRSPRNAAVWRRTWTPPSSSTLWSSCTRADAAPPWRCSAPT